MSNSPHESSPTHEKTVYSPPNDLTITESGTGARNQSDEQSEGKGNPAGQANATPVGFESSPLAQKASTPTPLTAIGPGQETHNLADSQARLDRVIANPFEQTNRLKRGLWDVAHLGGILCLIIWPWAFFGIVSTMNGLAMHDRLVEIVTRYPHRVSTVATLIGTLNQVAATFLFGKAIVRLGQELIDRRRHDVDAEGRRVQAGDMSVFRSSCLSAFRYMSLVWGLGTWSGLAKRKRQVLVLVAFLATWLVVQFVPSGIAGLITPGHVIRDTEISAMELDFTSSEPECLTWMEANRVRNTCDWKAFGSTRYTTCLVENQVFDVLDAGRANMLFSAANVSNQMSLLNQLGVGGSGIRFLGPMKGVLPLGPDGVPDLNFQPTPNPLVGYETPKMVSYNYTLNHQGLDANIGCSWDTTSPITFSPIPGVGTDRIFSSNGTCDEAAGLQHVLENIVQYPMANSNNSLAYWACKQIPQPGFLDPTYFVYLRGRVNYRSTIGNITCRITPLRAQEYSVRYESLLGYFVSRPTTYEEPSPLRSTFYRFVEWGLVGLGEVVWETQNWSNNMFAEAVFSAAEKNFNLSTLQRHDIYLSLYEALIEGILDYQATYSRLIYSIGSNPPQNCLRTVTGPASYSVRGWVVDSFKAGFLLPMTLINLASLLLLLVCLFIGKLKYRLGFDMMDNLTLLTANVAVPEGRIQGEIAWSDSVTFPQVSNLAAK
ncbi:hypothetical protein MD484_g6318, partial [Candolleomyces efflorescens]